MIEQIGLHIRNHHINVTQKNIITNVDYFSVVQCYLHISLALVYEYIRDILCYLEIEYHDNI